MHENSRKTVKEAQRLPELLHYRIVSNLGLGSGCVSDGGCTKLQVNWEDCRETLSAV
jgi:hypothetical protein